MKMTFKKFQLSKFNINNLLHNPKDPVGSLYCVELQLENCLLNFSQ